MDVLLEECWQLRRSAGSCNGYRPCRNAVSQFLRLLPPTRRLAVSNSGVPHVGNAAAEDRHDASKYNDMIFKETKLPSVFVIELERRSDERGFFARQWCAEEIFRAGLNPALTQINVARSIASGTLRGVHYQRAPHGEAKLVRCTRGAVFDVAVDLRAESPTFRQWVGIELDAESGRALYIPEGCGHGYLTLAPETELAYQASVAYAPASATGVRYDDPAFAIEWPAPIKVISAQDRSWPSFAAVTRATSDRIEEEAYGDRR
ncbi:MAG: dTDP-4-dehydrorhamnose 3,5-epimerase [Parvibaculaceae bacterium]